MAVVFWNYYANSGILIDETVGSISDKYSNLITPASYAFSIWGIIYLGLFVNAFFMLNRAFSRTKNKLVISQIGPWLIFTNIFSGLWIWFWLNEYIGISVIFMFAMLISLIKIILSLNMERWDAPRSIIAFVWWPICFYSGWITIASVTNVAAWLISIKSFALNSEIFWTVFMIFVAFGINLFMLIYRNMREYVLVGIWAFAAISYKHWDSIAIIQWTALFLASALLLLVFAHGYKNIKSNPFFGFKTGS